MTAPFSFGRPRRRLEIDPTRVNQALAFGEETDDIDQRLGAEEPEPQPRGMWARVKQALPDAVGNSLASNLDPQGGFVERFLGGIGRGYVQQQAGVRQREAEARDTDAEAMRIKLALLGRQQEQRRLDLMSREDPVAVPAGATLYDRDAGAPLYTAPGGTADRPLVTDWQKEGFPSLEAWQRYHERISRAGGGRTPREPTPQPGDPRHRQAWVAERAQRLIDGSGKYEGDAKLTPQQATQQAGEEYLTLFGLGGPSAHPPTTGGGARRSGRPPSGGTYQARPKGLPDPKATFDSLSQQFGGDLQKVRAEMERMGYRFAD